MTQPVEWYVNNVDEMLQRVISAWGAQTSAGNGKFLTPEFRVLFDKACQYKDAHLIAESRRENKIEEPSDKSIEQVARLGFAEACKAFDDALARNSTGNQQ